MCHVEIKTTIVLLVGSFVGILFGELEHVQCELDLWKKFILCVCVSGLWLKGEEL